MKRTESRIPLRFRSRDRAPAYYRIQRTLQGRIETGTLSAGEQIPPERELATEFGVSVGTVKRALLNLVQEDYLYRIQGKGTFVAGTSLRRESLRYYRLLRGFRDEQAELTVALRGVRRVEGRAPHNDYLRRGPDDALYEIERVLSAEEGPLVYTLSYVPAEMFRGLDGLPGGLFEKDTLYELLEERYGVTTVSNQELFGTAEADPRAARALGVEIGRTLLFVEMLSFTYKGVPYEYRRSYCRGADRKVFVEM